MVYEGGVDTLEKRIVATDGVEYAEYYLPDGLSKVCLFRIEAKVPSWVKMSQEEWTNGQKLCLESRIRGKCWLDELKGKVWGGDIMKPTLVE
jgi:hypothetical protein